MRQVSEKTLELNITAEILQIIRSLPGCNRAFWYGLKQDEESRLGIDELIQNVPTGYHLMLQFKSPKPMPQDHSPYFFTINDRQNDNLLRMARQYPQAVYYILPHFNTLTRVSSFSPTLSTDTWALQVNNLNGLPCSNNRQGTHKVESFGGSVRIYSEPKKENTIKLNILLKSLFENKQLAKAKEKKFISHEDLREWLKWIPDKTYIDKRVSGQLFRGLGTICMSTEEDTD